MAYEIETGIPLPTVRAGRTGTSYEQYPFRKLKPGASFFVEFPEGCDDEKAQIKFRDNLTSGGKRILKGADGSPTLRIITRITTRSEDDDTLGVRVWGAEPKPVVAAVEPEEADEADQDEDEFA